MSLLHWNYRCQQLSVETPAPREVVASERKSPHADAHALCGKKARDLPSSGQAQGPSSEGDDISFFQFD